jgi:LuxR family maltose regulon positive regulatory protein
VTGGSGAQSTLELLDRQNLFVVPLDDQRRWYRYHHLFADVLRARLADEQPYLVAGLHLRASEWHEHHGDPADAVTHALAGRHVERAARLVQAMLPALRRDRQQATARRWIEALPEHLVRANPVLSISYVGTLMTYGQLDGVETHLSSLERWMQTTEGSSATDAAGREPTPELRTLPAMVAMYRAAQARLRHDRDGTLLHAGRALALAGADDHVGRGAAQALLGLAHWSDGDVQAAARLYRSSIASLQRTESVADVLGCTIALADLELARGRLTQAYDAYQHGLHAAEREPSPPQGTADMHTGLGTLLLERGQTSAALEHLTSAGELGDSTGLPQNAYRWRLAMADVRLLEGDPPAPSCCSTRRSASTALTSHQTCGRSRRCEPGPGCGSGARRTPLAWASSEGCHLTTSRPTCGSSSTSPWRASCSTTRPTLGALRCSSKDCWTGCSQPPSWPDGPAPCWTCWCCRRWQPKPASSRTAQGGTCAERSRSPSHTGTCGC